ERLPSLGKSSLIDSERRRLGLGHHVETQPASEIDRITTVGEKRQDRQFSLEEIVVVPRARDRLPAGVRRYRRVERVALPIRDLEARSKLGDELAPRKAQEVHLEAEVVAERLLPSKRSVSRDLKR